MGKNHRFATLDALRGFAALAVLTGHLKAAFGGAPLQHFDLAVDFFFVLSGFVLTHAYQHKLNDGMTPLAFMRERLIRMYPLYLFGTALLAVYTGARVFLLGDFPLTASEYAVMVAFAAAFLPTPIVHPERPDIYPLNPPAWSLLFELISNVAMALLARRLSIRVLAFLIITGFIAQSVLALDNGAFSMGWSRATFWGGLARVTFSFFAGVAVYRIWRARPMRRPLPTLVLIPLLLVILGIPTARESSVYYEIAATLIFPVLVYVGASATPRPMLRGLCLEAGALSYALYAVHVPLVYIAGSISAKALGAPLEAFAPWSGIIVALMAVILAALLNRVYDTPVRRFLTKRMTLLPRPQALRP